MEDNGPDGIVEAVRKFARAETAEVDTAESRRVTVVRITRTNELTLEQREVWVDVEDYGPQSPVRWRVTANDRQGRIATGNGADKLDVALAIVHWEQLD